MDLGIRGRKALLVGASRGLGKACALALAHEGVDITIVARKRDALEATGAEIAAATGVKVTTVAGDITTKEGRAAALAACPAPDILLNNADGPQPGDFRDWSREDWIAALDMMMLSHIEMMRLTVDGMMARGFGRILNIVSRSVKIPQASSACRTARAPGLVGFAGGLARQTVAHNVTINNLLAGYLRQRRAARAHPRHAAGDRQDVRRGLAGARRRQSGQALRQAGRARRLLRLPLLGACRLHHRPKPADRRRKLSGDVLTDTSQRGSTRETRYIVSRAGLRPHRAARRRLPSAQAYPSRTVTVVVPFPAGGSVDGVARILVQKLNETVGQHFIVENRAGGASGIVGASAVAKAAARRLHAAGIGLGPRHQPAPLQERAV